MNTSLGVIIFSRSSSTRLPHKAFIKINKKELLLRAIESCKHLSKDLPVIVATSENKNDDTICELAKMHKVKIFRGSLNNVLERAYKTCLEFDLTHFIRFCGDRPLFPKSLINFMINSFEKKKTYDLISSKLSNNQLPPGLTAEIVSKNSLEIILKNTHNQNHLEHITSFIYENEQLFKTESFQDIPPINWDNMKFVIDTKEDLKKINWISRCLPQDIHKTNLIESLEILHSVHSRYSIIGKSY